MFIGDRKWLILQAIIEDYISTAEPVGSRTISKKYVTDVSPATIRNEMSDLEDMGFIEQPHTSSGRVPSEKGYRLYVDKLMEKNNREEVRSELLLKELKETIGEVDRLVKHASKILSNMTSYASFITAPQIRKNRLQKIQLIKISRNVILAVIITDGGIVKNATIRDSGNISEDIIEKLNLVLNRNLRGADIESLETADLITLGYPNPTIEEILSQIKAELFQALTYSDNMEIYSNGAYNLLGLPEYADVGKAKSFFNLFEDNDKLSKIITLRGEDIIVSIGSENPSEQLRDSSLITATYKLDGRTIGSVGVIGPTRMEYSKVLRLVDLMTNNLTDILSGLLKEGGLK